MAVAVPKDDWTPARLKDHRAWRSKMYAQPRHKPDPMIAKAMTVAKEADPLDDRVADLERLVSELRAQLFQTRQILSARQDAGQEPEAMPRYRLADIVCVVAKYYGAAVLDVKSSRRTVCLTRPRHVAMYLCRTLTLRSLPEIGRHLGGRDHTTVLHGVRKIEAAMPLDITLCQEIAEIEALLNGPDQINKA